MLAGPEGSVLSLYELGVRDLSRPLSSAEVALLREALTGCDLVGYVCRGIGAAGQTGVAPDHPSAHPGARARLVVVTDHVNLTWRSPLTGPNDDSVGPRFPSMTGIYAPDVAVDRLAAAKGMIVVSAGVVAGVHDEDRLTPFEAEMVELEGYRATSSELVPVVIVAAHMGLGVAAVVMTRDHEDKGDG